MSRKQKLNPSEVIDAIEEIGPDFTVGQLAKRLGVSAPTSRKYLTQVQDDGLAIVLTYAKGKRSVIGSEEDMPYVAASAKMIAKWVTTLSEFGYALRETKMLPGVKQAIAELPEDRREKMAQDTMKIKYLVDMAMVESEFDGSRA